MIVTLECLNANRLVYAHCFSGIKLDIEVLILTSGNFIYHFSVFSAVFKEIPSEGVILTTSWVQEKHRVSPWRETLCFLLT